ncbi:MAG: diphthine synthase [Candidatus Aenigmarchaeota archaeon]|nr:diphthine synthase [Candidatus Aenigmarchaeota archaeon]
MLYLIGAGLWDEGDIALKGLEAARKCSRVYFERYTSLWKGDLEKIGLKAEDFARPDMEDNMSKLIGEAKEKDVCVLVPGDPLIATTHSSIITEARKEGVKVEVIHSSSIFSALGETGLQVYKFGRTATIPHYETDAPYKILEQNLWIGAHSLFLLDIQGQELMKCSEGLKKLLEMEGRGKKGIISEDTEVLVFCRAGSPEKALKWGKVRDFLDFDCTLCVIIVPGPLHFAEREYLEQL